MLYLVVCVCWSGLLPQHDLRDLRAMLRGAPPGTECPYLSGLREHQLQPLTQECAAALAKAVAAHLVCRERMAEAAGFHDAVYGVLQRLFNLLVLTCRREKKVRRPVAGWLGLASCCFHRDRRRGFKQMLLLML